MNRTFRMLIFGLLLGSLGVACRPDVSPPVPGVSPCKLLTISYVSDPQFSFKDSLLYVGTVVAGYERFTGVGDTLHFRFGYRGNQLVARYQLNDFGDTIHTNSLFYDYDGGGRLLRLRQPELSATPLIQLSYTAHDIFFQKGVSIWYMFYPDGQGNLAKKYDPFQLNGFPDSLNYYFTYDSHPNPLQKILIPEYITTSLIKNNLLSYRYAIENRDTTRFYNITYNSKNQPLSYRTPLGELLLLKYDCP